MLSKNGRRSEKYSMRRLPDLQELAFVEMGEFTSAALKRCVERDCHAVTLAGMVGNFSKVAQGHFMTHVAGNQVDLVFLATIAAESGASAAVQDEFRAANTARHFQEIALAHGLGGVFDRIAADVRRAARTLSSSGCAWRARSSTSTGPSWAPLAGETRDAHPCSGRHQPGRLDGLPMSTPALNGAVVLVGGERHQRLPTRNPAERVVFKRDAAQLAEEVERLLDAGRRVAVWRRATRSFFGIGPLLAERLGAQRVRIYPNVAGPTRVRQARARLAGCAGSVCAWTSTRARGAGRHGLETGHPYRYGAHVAVGYGAARGRYRTGGRNVVNGAPWRPSGAHPARHASRVLDMDRRSPERADDCLPIRPVCEVGYCRLAGPRTPMSTSAGRSQSPMCVLSLVKLGRRAGDVVDLGAGSAR